MKYKCPKCGAIFEGPVKYCPECGQELKIAATEAPKKEEPKKKYKCSKCGTIFEGEVKFCPGCGTEIKFKSNPEPAPAPAEEPKTFVAPEAPVNKEAEEKGETELKQKMEEYESASVPQVVEEVPVFEPAVEEKPIVQTYTSAPTSAPVKKKGSPVFGIISFLFSFVMLLAVIGVGMAAAVACLEYCVSKSYISESFVTWARNPVLLNILGVFANGFVAGPVAYGNLAIFIFCIVFGAISKKKGHKALGGWSIAFSIFGIIFGFVVTVLYIIYCNASMIEAIVTQFVH